MTDYFALLGEPRRPWLDAEALKAKFISLSADAHPDRVHSSDFIEKAAASGRFAELNAAYSCLREPKERLRHLLELELGSKPADLHQIPSDLANLFIEVAGLCGQADVFLVEREKVSSPLLRAQLFERSQDWSDRLLAVQRKIIQRHNALVEQIQSADRDWLVTGSGTAERGELLRSLERYWRLLGFFTRWNMQIQERLVRITF